MKKLKVSVGIIATLIFCSCIDSDPEVMVNFVYRNISNNPIKVDAFSPRNENGQWENGERLTFELGIKQQYTIKLSFMGNSYDGEPLLYLYEGWPTGRDSVIITNKSSVVIQRSWLEDSFLYDSDSYQLTKPSKYHWVYTYEFNDQFFKDNVTK